MKKIFVPLLLVCLGMFVAACGPASNDSPSGDGGRADSAENGGGTAGDASVDTDKGTTSGAANDGTAEAADAATDVTGEAAADAAKQEPLEAPDEDINLSLDPPENK